MSLHFNLHITCLFIFYITITTNAQNTPFAQNYVTHWGAQNIQVLDQGREVRIKIDSSSGGGIKSKQAYGSGIFALKIKIPQHSNGIATTFYLSSASDNGPAGAHAELDFELLGHNGPPYTLNTNIFAQDSGRREQQFNLWFDPTSDFHEYKFIWNENQTVFFVDGIPIRIYQNDKKRGVRYPTAAMYAHATLWNGSQWLGSTNWSKGPFFASFQEFAVDGCSNKAKCDSSKYQWRPSTQEMQKYQDIRKTRMTFNYCQGKARNNFPECKHNAQETAFNQNYVVGWGGDHVNVLDRGREVQIKIDPSSGLSFQLYNLVLLQEADSNRNELTPLVSSN